RLYDQIDSTSCHRTREIDLPELAAEAAASDDVVVVFGVLCEDDSRILAIYHVDLRLHASVKRLRRVRDRIRGGRRLIPSEQRRSLGLDQRSFGLAPLGSQRVREDFLPL